MPYFEQLKPALGTAEPIQTSPLEATSNPLTFTQERIWYSEQRMPESGAYNMPFALFMRGLLDEDVLDDAFQEIGRRHPITTSRIMEVNGRPVQTTGTQTVPRLERIDVAGETEEQRLQQARQMADEEAKVPFDLREQPPMRYRLLRITPSQHVLLLTVHHIMADGWSVGLLFSELQQLYLNGRQQRPLSLPAKPGPFGDYAAQRQAGASAEEMETSLEYWSRQLGTAPASLRLPAHKPVGRDTGVSGEQVYHDADPRLVEALTQFVAQGSTTHFVLLLATLQILLARMTGENNIPVLCALANRDSSETQCMIGPVLTMATLNTHLGQNPSVAETLAKVRTVLHDAYLHADVPFDRLLERMVRQRGSHQALNTQIAFNFDRMGETSFQFDGLDVEPWYSERGIAKVELTIFVRLGSDRLQIAAEYNTDVYTAEAVSHLLQLYEECLTAMLEDPNRRLSSLPLFRREIADVLSLPVSRVQQLSPLTPTQRDLYLGSRMASAPAEFNLVSTLALGADLDVKTWEQAASEIMSAEDCTRTRLALLWEQPLQFVDPMLAVDSCVLMEATWEGALQEVIQAEMNLPFDLESGPLFRLALVKVEGAYTAVLATHHIVSDGSSNTQLLLRIAQRYACVLSQTTPEPPAPSFYQTIPDALATFDTPKTMELWAAQARDLQALVTHPENTASTLSRELTARLDGAALQEIRRYCLRKGITLPTFLLAAYGLAVYRLCDPSQGFVISQVRHGRPPGFKKSVGCFYQVQPVVFHAGFFDESSLTNDLLALVGRANRLGASGDKISLLGQRRLFSRESTSPAFFYNFSSFKSITHPLNGRPALTTLALKVAHDEVHLFVTDMGASVELKVYAHDSHMDDKRFADRIAHCATELVKLQPLARIATVLSAEVVAFQGPSDPASLPGASWKPAHQLIAEQALRSPQRVAVRASAGGTSVELSYREMMDRATAWQARLRALPSQPIALIVLLAERDAQYLCLMLGILQSGLAFLPLDPAQPPDRLHRILQQSGATVLVASTRFGELAGTLLEQCRAESIEVQTLWMEETSTDPSPEALPQVKVDPQDLSYVIFTSGSTGAPKGAMVTHDGMRNHLQAKVTELKLGGGDVLAETASQAVDVSVWQYLSVLQAGGCVQVLSDEVARSPQALLEAVDEHGITVLEIVPSMLYAMLAILRLGGEGRPSLGSLRWLVVNGEVLPPQLCLDWFTLYPGVSLINAYGPTECSDDVTQYAIHAPEDVTRRRVPLGHVLQNLRLHMLDRGGRPVPPGTPGHLHVGGIGVGRGYLNDPVRTALAFVPDPFSRSPGSRLYSTGDLAIANREGVLDFLGRIDFQVKIRGNRVELGEVESALSRMSGVHQVAVDTYTAEPGDQRLIAYIVCVEPGALGVREVLDFARAQLPEYMLPSVVTFLEAMPLLSSEKVDRKALRQIPQVQADENFIPPETEMEVALAGIWEEVLSRPRVGLEDDFFQLGGHSLLATQVTARVRNRFGIRLPLRQIFNAPRLWDLARVAEAILAESLPAEDDLAALIEQVQSLTPEQLQAELASFQPARGN